MSGLPKLVILLACGATILTIVCGAVRRIGEIAWPKAKKSDAPAPSKDGTETNVLLLIIYGSTIVGVALILIALAMDIWDHIHGAL